MVNNLFAAVATVVLLSAPPSMANPPSHGGGAKNGVAVRGAGAWHGNGNANAWRGNAWRGNWTYNGQRGGVGWRGGAGGYWWGGVWVPYRAPVAPLVCCDLWGRPYPAW
jgi:hypothetical protein